MRWCSFALSLCCWVICSAIWWVLLPLAYLQKKAGNLSDEFIEDMHDITYSDPAK